MNDLNLDRDVIEYIERTCSFDSDNEKRSPESQRESYNALCRAFAAPRPEQVAHDDFHIDSGGYRLAMRGYRCRNGGGGVALLYLHGGGFVVGDLESHDSICAEICAATGLDLFAVDYRLAPEYSFPRDVEDALAAFHHVAADYDHVIVGGDSAGGTLTAGVCVATRTEALAPAGQLHIYPAFGGDHRALESYRVHANAPLLTLEMVLYYNQLRAGGTPPRDPLFSPLLQADFSGMPACRLFSADVDPLRDDAAEYARRLAECGVDVDWCNEEGLIHGYLRARHCTQRGKAAFARICAAVSELAQRAAGGA